MLKPNNVLGCVRIPRRRYPRVPDLHHQRKRGAASRANAELPDLVSTLTDYYFLVDDFFNLLFIVCNNEAQRHNGYFKMILSSFCTLTVPTLTIRNESTNWSQKITYFWSRAIDLFWLRVGFIFKIYYSAAPNFKR